MALAVKGFVMTVIGQINYDFIKDVRLDIT